MPYVIVATQMIDDGPRGMIYGPTVVGDQHSDPILMGQLNASVTKILGYNFFQFTTEDLPRVVLDKLDGLGYRVVAMTGTYPEWSWILHKEGPSNK